MAKQQARIGRLAGKHGAAGGIKGADKGLCDEAIEGGRRGGHLAKGHRKKTTPPLKEAPASPSLRRAAGETPER
eukprot:gene4027-4256_t